MSPESKGVVARPREVPTLYFASPDDPSYKGVLVFDIRHSTAILEDLTAADRPIQWIRLMEKIRSVVADLTRSGPFEIYKFLGDGWILIYQDGPKTLHYMLHVLRSVEQAYLTAYGELIQPVLRDPDMPSPGITFGITWGHVIRCQMNGQTEYVGKPINEACRLQAKAEESGAETEGSRGIVSTGLYSKFEKELAGLVKPHKVALRNVAKGKEIVCYKVIISSFRDDSI